MMLAILHLLAKFTVSLKKAGLLRTLPYFSLLGKMKLPMCNDGDVPKHKKISVKRATRLIAYLSWISWEILADPLNEVV